MATYDKSYMIRYLEGELTPEERAGFEAALQSDPALVAELAECRELMETLRQRLPQDDTKAALRRSMQELNRVHFKRGAKLVSFKRYYTGVAAVAAIIILAVVLWPRGDYMDRWGATQMLSSSERGDNTDTLLQQASVYFNNKQFDKALPLLEKAVAVDSSNTMALFYRGVTKLHTHAIDAGRRDLERVYGSESVFRYEAAFYVAISYAQEKNTAVAKEWLQKIPEGTAVSEKAGELRKKME